MVTGSFLFVAKAGDGGLGSILPRPVGYGIGAAITILGLMLFVRFLKNKNMGFASQRNQSKIK
jgi:hypothetical protein